MQDFHAKCVKLGRSEKQEEIEKEIQVEEREEIRETEKKEFSFSGSCQPSCNLHSTCKKGWQRKANSIFVSVYLWNIQETGIGSMLPGSPSKRSTVL